ncbi:hypothetical protein HYH03_007043 [Edaphochlamys debaryana]|uniref:Uncharacterized protein n=1 Tax=Edaphochlamys debaryana TaxID=47281 RepID=A0A836BZM0_9CHLO|nr:hypothetical protein HYH03_007043 [Edaphochlamys debaryana]|eukprot:KAG2494800.1 hypothetical protein HYH03_007043 [Edaphochlamys debaryana]
MRQLKVKVRDATVATRVPTLERWPRVSSLDLLLDDVIYPLTRAADDPLDPPELDTQMLLPVTRQPLACRQRITSLAVRLEHLDPVDPISPVAISALPLWFPSLKDLNLDLPIATSSSLQLRYMYDALATLPHLESLRVPNCIDLSGVGALRNSLRRLRIKEVVTRGLIDLAIGALPDTLSLHKLEKLEVENGWAEAAFVHGLLRGCARGGRSIDVCLELTVMEGAEANWGGNFGFTFSAGVLKEVRYDGHLTDLCMASKVLRASPEVLPGETVLRLAEVRLQAELLPEERVQMLRSDLKRFVRVEVEGLALSREPAVPSLAPLVQARQLFGSPRQLTWCGFRNSVELSTAALTAAEQRAAAAQRHDGAAKPPLPPPCALPKPEAILQRAVDRLAAAARPDCLQPDADIHTPVLLARGSVVATLAHTPTAVLPWLQALAVTSDSLLPGAKGEDVVAEVKVLPTAAAVLVRCGEARGAAAALLAAAAAATRGQPHGSLELVPLGLGWHPDEQLEAALQQEMQRALDAGAAHGSDACLAWAVSVFAFLARLP